MPKIQEYVDIKQFSTLRVGGQFRYFANAKNIENIIEAYNFAKEKDIPIFVLGGGSNVIFSDGVLDILALKIEVKGFEIVSQENDCIDIKVGAGEIWDEIVSRTVDMNLSGLESLSGIPGTVGASPVQNIGAYGSEVKDTILQVEVFDIEKGTITNILNEDCKFGYRDSIFKNEAKGKYVITSVVYRLNKLDLNKQYLSRFPALSYPGVMKYFEVASSATRRKGGIIENPSLKQIRKAIINIRKEKLPNPKEFPNVGSFFKNPIVLNEIAYKIIEEYPNAKFFALKDDFTKIPAGWLIENAGLKGESFGNVSVYSKNALVLVNNCNATSEDVLRAKNEIIKAVKEKFGIELEQEPEIL